MNEKVSVIIPVYNAENYIEKCVESLVHGTYKNIELILINDASKDRSYEICLALKEKYNCIQLLNNKVNHGVSYTRNKGLHAATGELIMFTDSDDWVEPDYINSMVEQYSKNQDAFIICGYVNHDEVKNGRTDVFGWNDFTGIQIVDRTESLYELYQQRLLQQLWNKLFRRDVIEKYQIQFDELISIGEDFRFLLQYLKASNIKKIVKYNRPLYHYSRDNQMSLMTRYGQEKIEEPLYNFKLLFELMEYSKTEIEERLRKEKEEIILNYGYAIIHNETLSKKERIELMKENIGADWEKSYRFNQKLLYKEKISAFIRKEKN
jgi:glycosyltransferase involved in cell wall biosynthesis